VCHYNTFVLVQYHSVGPNNCYAVTQGLNDISGIFKERNECSKVVLNVKAGINQGSTTYEQAKEILALTGGTFQIYIYGRSIPCGKYGAYLQ
jgi:hypothetical protein